MKFIFLIILKNFIIVIIIKILYKLIKWGKKLNNCFNGIKWLYILYLGVFVYFW